MPVSCLVCVQATRLADRPSGWWLIGWRLNDVRLRMYAHMPVNMHVHSSAFCQSRSACLSVLHTIDMYVSFCKYICVLACMFTFRHVCMPDASPSVYSHPWSMPVPPGGQQRPYSS